MFAGPSFPPKHKQPEWGRRVEFSQLGVLFLAALAMGLAACGGGSMSPQRASAAQASPNSPQSALANNTSAADLSSANIGSGSGVKVYVQAVGKPSIINHLSAPVTF